MKHVLTIGWMAVMGFTLTLVGCKKDNEPAMDDSLYARLGGTLKVNDPANPGQMIEKGRLGLRSVVDSTIFVIAANPRLQPYFGPLLTEVTAGNLTNLAILSRNLTDFFAVATGSKNDRYTGMNMRDAHNPARNPRMAMASDNQAFDDFVAAVVVGAQQNKVPMPLIQEVGQLIETLRGDVVQR